MADKGRFEGLVVNFQNLPPKSGEPGWKIWAKWMLILLVAAGIMNLLSRLF